MADKQVNNNSLSNCALLNSLRRQVSQKKQYRLSLADDSVITQPHNSVKSLNRLNSYDLTMHRQNASSRHSLKHQYHSHCYYHHYFNHNNNNNNNGSSNHHHLAPFSRTFSDSILNKLKNNRKPDPVEIVRNSSVLYEKIKIKNFLPFKILINFLFFFQKQL